MDGINIKEFVKENESMTQMEINKDIIPVFNAMSTRAFFPLIQEGNVISERYAFNRIS